MTDTDDTGTSMVLERVSTGIAGLDVITDGGFFRGGVYMVLARPGAGKTITANHICYRHVANGGRAVYMTLLAETHARMISAITPMKFFEPAAVGAGMTYLSGYSALESGKLKGLLDLLRKTVRAQKATVLVIDGLVTVGAVAGTDLETKKFIHELQVFVELAGCTTLLLTGARSDEQYALRTMVDGLLELDVDSVGPRAVRSIEVTKFRGGASLLGRHLMDISDAGITVHPRTEQRRGLVRPEPDVRNTSRAGCGVTALDEMLHGGLRADSVTLVLGAPGSGKTTLGLSFLCAGAKTREPGLYFGFFEPPGVLLRKADALGLRLSDHVKKGSVQLMSQSSRSTFADALAETLLQAVRDRGVKRLFIDGLGGFTDSLLRPERTVAFFGALCDELRSMGVVTVLSEQERVLPCADLPENGLVPLVDNIIALRHVESGASVRKLVAVVKMREGECDSSLREFTIGKNGIVVSPASPAPITKTKKKRGAGRDR